MVAIKKNDLQNLLADLHAGTITPEKAEQTLGHLHAESIGFATIDHHRWLRTGFGEVVYGAGKTDQQVAAICKKLMAARQPVLITRTTKTACTKIKKFAATAIFHEASGAITIPPKTTKKNPAPTPIGSVLIISAGTSDIGVAEEALVTAQIMGSNAESLYDVGVAGIHRLFAHADKLQNARVIVVVAGMDGALASVVGGLVAAPVIAVPTSVGYGASFGGVSALLAMLNSCATGVSVMNIDNGFGAGAMAHRINSLPERVFTTP